jgi:MtN3 and saliva related transmembrane protein
LNADLLGYAAGTLTTLCFVPQAVKVVRERAVSGVSLTMYLGMTAGVAGWLAYGIAIRRVPVIVFNAVTLALCLLIVVQLVRLRREAGV